MDVYLKEKYFVFNTNKIPQDIVKSVMLECSASSHLGFVSDEIQMMYKLSQQINFCEKEV